MRGESIYRVLSVIELKSRWNPIPFTSQYSQNWMFIYSTLNN